MTILMGDPGGGIEPATVAFGDFWIPGRPLPQPRPGFRLPKHGKPFVTTYTQDHKDKRHATWRKTVWAAARFVCPKLPLDEPIVMSLNVYVPRPQNLMGARYFDGPIPHPVQGDIDNYGKAIMDAISEVKGVHPGMWVNDGRVFGVHWFKYYTAKDKDPGAYVLLETIHPDSRVNFPTHNQHMIKD